MTRPGHAWCDRPSVPGTSGTKISSGCPQTRKSRYLTKALCAAPPAVQRPVFEAFELKILYAMAERRIEISATVSEAVASAFENK